MKNQAAVVVNIAQEAINNVVIQHQIATALHCLTQAAQASPQSLQFAAQSQGLVDGFGATGHDAGRASHHGRWQTALVSQSNAAAIQPATAPTVRSPAHDLWVALIASIDEGLTLLCPTREPPLLKDCDPQKVATVQSAPNGDSESLRVDSGCGGVFTNLTRAILNSMRLNFLLVSVPIRWS